MDMSLIKSEVRLITNACGFDIQLLSKSARHHLRLALRSMKIRTVIDVGANTGQFASSIRTILPNTRIMCFEPLPRPFEDLKVCARKQGGRVSAYNMALGEREGEIEMFQHPEFTPSSSILRSTSLSHSLYPHTKCEIPLAVRLTSLDAFLEEIRNERPEPDVLITLDCKDSRTA